MTANATPLTPPDSRNSDRTPNCAGLTTLDPLAGYVTIINTYTVAPERADALVDLLVRTSNGKSFRRRVRPDVQVEGRSAYLDFRLLGFGAAGPTGGPRLAAATERGQGPKNNAHMPTPHPPPLMLPDYVAPVIAAGVFILLMGFVLEPARRTVNALIVAGASGAYLSGGAFGVWEIAHPVVAMTFAYAGLRSYRSIAIASVLLVLVAPVVRAKR